VFGLAIGFLLRHTAGAITIGLALIFVVSGLTGLIPGSIGEWIFKLMPANAGAQITQFGESAHNSQSSKVFSPWAGFGVFCLEIAVLLIAGALLFEKRDA